MPSKIPNYTSIDSRLFSENPIQYTTNPEIVVENKNLINEYNLTHISKKIPELLQWKNSQDFHIFSQAYAGHQFWGFSILWDGRAHIIKELEHEWKLYDLQLKWSGRTQYSRTGDGRANLSAMLREYLISESMNSLWIPSSRSLGVYITGQEVYREDDRIGAVLARFARSHIRVGTFEYISILEDTQLLQNFTDYTIHRHFPEISKWPNKYLDFIYAVAEKQVSLITHWLRVGFIHGVMNSDNTFISGETLDYGPCAFLNGYDPQKVFSSIDTNARYSFLNQSQLIIWNLSLFVESLLPLLDSDTHKAIIKAREALDNTQKLMQSSYATMMHKKIGLTKETKISNQLIVELLRLMHENNLDYTNTFVSLEKVLWTKNILNNDIKILKDWVIQWKENIANTETSIQIMGEVNPKIIPRNHLVEKALKKAREWDMEFFHTFSRALSTPYSEPSDSLYTESDPNDSSHKTFCGT